MTMILVSSWETLFVKVRPWTSRKIAPARQIDPPRWRLVAHYRTSSSVPHRLGSLAKGNSLPTLKYCWPSSRSNRK